MKLKSILILLALVVAVGGYVLLTSKKPEAEGPVETALFDFTPDQITALRATYKGDAFAVARNDAGRWTIEEPTRWPALTSGVERLLTALASLHYRFAPIQADAADFDWESYGLASPQMAVQVAVGDEAHTLAIGTIHGEQFNRRAYVRVDDQQQILEVGAELHDRLAELTRDTTVVRERILFPSEQYKEHEWDEEETSRVQADSLTVASPDGELTLQRDGETWRLAAPMADRPEPDKLKALLKAVPTLWVENFVKDDPTPEDLKEFGLDPPERRLTVVTGKHEVALAIGKFHRENTYTVTKSVPMPQMPGRPPQGPQEQKADVTEEFYYAKLPDYPAIFEVKAAKFDFEGKPMFSARDLRGNVAKLDDVFLKPDDLRDKKVVRFERYDANHVDLTYQDLHLELTKKDYDWRLVKPTDTKADHSTVSGLLSATGDLEATEFVYADDLKTYGLDEPAGKLVVTTEKEEEQKGTKDKKKVKKTFTLLIGKAEPDAKVVYLKLADENRVSGVDPKYLETVKKGRLDYRSKDVLSFTKADLLTLEVKQADDHFIVRKDGDDYQFLQPGTGAADKDGVNGIVDKLTSLRAEKFIAEDASDEDLAKYGLKDEPAIRAVLTVKAKDEKKKDDDKDAEKKEDEKEKAEEKQRVHTLLVGKPTEEDDEHRYARLEAGRVVFTIGKDPIEKLQTRTLALLPKKLWDFDRADVQNIDVQQDAKGIRLENAEAKWRLTKPVNIAAGSGEVDRLLDKLTGLEADHYVALRAEDLAKYGLAKPYLTVTLGVQEQAGDKKFKTYVLKLGAPEAEGEKPRYAMRSGEGASEAVFVLSEPVIEQLTQDHLTYLDRRLVDVARDAIVRYESTRGERKFDLATKDGKWTVAAPVALEPASAELDMLLGGLAQVKAERFVALGEVDLKKYGLDKPYLSATLTTEKTVEVPPPPEEPNEADDDKEREEAERKPQKKIERSTIALVVGNTTAADSQERYAMVKGKEAVAVLSADTVTTLASDHLDLLDKKILTLDADKVVRFESSRAGVDLKIEKGDDGWQINAPKKLKADQDAVTSLLADLAPLKATAFAAYQAADLKPYGLEKPFATLRFVLKKDEDKTETTVVLLGAEVAKDKAGRYALLEGQKDVFVLGKDLAAKLAGDTLAFRDRRVLDLDKDAVEKVLVARLKSSTPATFAKKDDDWKLAAPVKGDAESLDLKDMVRDAAKLKAERFVAEGVAEADLTKYGLAPKPFAEVTLQTKAKEGAEPAAAQTHVIQVGSPVGKDDGDRHACIKGSGLVFVLAKKTVETLTKEFRKRDVLGWLDATNVTDLALTRGSDKLHLTKDGDTWKVKGDDASAVDKDKVQETLDALAGLKITSYVQDTDDNLALYGLKEPELALVAKTANAEKTLHLGRTTSPERGERYGRVADKDQHGVFLIGEDDHKKLFRKKSDFLKD